MQKLTVDLMIHHGDKWITTPQLVYDKKYVTTRRDMDSDHIGYNKIVEEYKENFGFLLVKQLLVKNFT